MSIVSSTACQHAVHVSSRRRLLRMLSGGALSGLTPFALSEHGGSVKKRKKHQRRKQRRNTRQPPEPQVRATASCPLPEDRFFIFGPTARLAQTFTANTSGNLVRVDLGIDSQLGSDSNYLLRLAPLTDGIPTEAALATAQARAAGISPGVSLVSFTLATPARVVAGTSYALILAVDGDEKFSWASRLGTVCGGRAFVADGIATPFEPRNDRDFVFTTFVQG